jgi:hypothetical protein
LHHAANHNSHGKFLNKLSEEFKFELERNLGPGSYDKTPKPLLTNIGHNLQSSKERIFDYTNKYPGPGQYDIDRAMIPKKPYTQKGPLSSFAGTVLRHKINLRDPVDMRKQLDLDLIKKKKVTLEDLKIPGPGPGEYGDVEAFEYMKDYRPENARGGRAFMVDDHDKFGDNEEYREFVHPGPGAYEKVGDFDLAREKALVSGAAFLSESERTPFGQMKVGGAPNKYNPGKLPQAISFHFNVHNGWV